MVHPEQILAAAKAGAMDDPTIYAFVRGLVDGTISRPQAAAWLAWSWSRTLTPRETLTLTRAMTESGTRLTWGEGAPLIDKHSTGGVGDKVSLVLAPLWAELGFRVPMISGRGLGHTGGTLDKLSAIPGFSSDLPAESLATVLDEVGCFISGQTSDLVPADRTLYALRNETSTVDSIPLIVASILSKKFAEGVDRLVLDIKVGSGAFMKTPERAAELARALVGVATDGGVETVAWITAMDRPLGRAIGNAVEVEEAVACLQGGGPADLRAITLAFADHPEAAGVLDSGRAYERFLRMVRAQGGETSALGGRSAPAGLQEWVVSAQRSGVVSGLDAGLLGTAAFLLGAGRRRAEDPVDPDVGLLVEVEIGERVEPGQPLVRLLHRRGRALGEALRCVEGAVRVTDEDPRPWPLMMDRIRAADRSG